VQPAPYAPDETGRLIALHDLRIVDTPPERRFDRIVQLAARLANCPVGILTFVDETRVFFKSVTGAEAAGVVLGTPYREYWFGSHIVVDGKPLVVADARIDDRFDRLPVVAPAGPETPVVGYAGVPVRAPGGEFVGALAVLSTEVRHFTDCEVSVLAELARLIEAELSSLPRSTIDGLTGAVNARTFLRFGNRLIELADSRAQRCVVLRTDVVGMTVINTGQGFEVGDQVLRDTARLLGSTVRGSDLIGRVGPDEFGVLLIGTDEAGARIALDRVHKAVDEYNRTGGASRTGPLRLQIGVVEHRPGTQADLASLLTSAALMGELGL
jgi:diguanylate cyclase (GGDEF)-like protein